MGDKKIKETNSDCYFYNWGNNLNFDYKCPREYGARCEYYDKFFSAKNFTGEGLDPDCTICNPSSLEKEVLKENE
jgi:hypothetical protein